jgi:uncharacterized protein
MQISMNKQVETFIRPKARPDFLHLLPLLGAVVLVLFLFAPVQAAEKAIPRPSGYVNDFAHVIDEASTAKIGAICHELDEKTGSQIAVATFSDLGGDEIDGFTNRLFDQWMPGQKGVNNGILIVNAVAERVVRIEVGYGLEPIIPDAVAGRVRRDIMNPLLKEGKSGEAFLGATAALASIIAKDQNVTLASLSGVQVPETQAGGRGRRGFPLGLLVPFGFILLAVISRGNRYRGGGGPFIGGPFIGGGFGGGGFGGGGGGFGGFGGGMSGGGGSSGGY